MVAVVALMLGCLPAAKSAVAQDSQTALAEAQARAVSAETEVATAQHDVVVAQQGLTPVAKRAAAAGKRAEDVVAHVDRLEGQMVDRRVRAAREVASAKAAYRGAVDDHDEQVGAAYGVAIGAALLAVLACFWEWFRRLPIIERLADQALGRAAAILVVLSLIVALIGGALLSGPRVVGGAVLTFGLGLVVAIAIARHSIRRQRGESQALFSRGRLPRAVSLIVAGLLAILFAFSLVDAVSEPDPDPPEISTSTSKLADAAQGDPANQPTKDVRQAAVTAKPMVDRAKRLEVLRAEAQHQVDRAQDVLDSARSHLVAANDDVDHFTTVIARQAARAERQAAIAAREADDGADEAALAPASPTLDSGDLDCDDVGETDFPVGPSDPNGFDADGDGIGCES